MITKKSFRFISDNEQKKPKEKQRISKVILAQDSNNDHYSIIVMDDVKHPDETKVLYNKIDPSTIENKLAYFYSLSIDDVKEQTGEVSVRVERPTN